MRKMVANYTVVSRLIAEKYPSLIPTDFMGDARCSADFRGCGFLLKTKPAKKFLPRLLERICPRRRPFIGSLLFEGEKKWTLSVYGEEHMELMTQIARDITEACDVSVCAKLASEREYEEYIPASSSMEA